MRLRLGGGAVGSVPLKHVNPSTRVRQLCSNLEQGARVENCVVLRQEKKKIGGREQDVVVFHCEELFGELELYTVVRWFLVTQEGPSEDFFDQASVPASQRVSEETEAPTSEVADAIERAQTGPLDDEDIAIIRGAVETDDDNLPLPENVPTENTRVYATGDNWDHDGVCPRRASSAANNRPSLPNVQGPPSLVKLFEVLFPVDFTKLIMLPKMNETLQPPVSYGEFLRWLGLWFTMATVPGQQRRNFWSQENVSLFSGAPFRLSEFMSHTRFENILRALAFTDKEPPASLDRFWEVRDIIDAWKANMKTNFVPGWVNCVDESMSVWTNMNTCPGFMFVPRNPWPFGNEWHTICCCLSGVLFDLELVEGKDEPLGRGRKEFDDKGKTVGLLLRLTKNIWNTGKLVILDSSYCVPNGLIELRTKGVFASAVIKKRRYWPKYIDGDAIKAHFDGLPPGTSNSLKGSLHSQDFHVFAMKEPDHVMMLMSTYGAHNREGGKESKRQWMENGVQKETTFRYPEVVNNHDKYRRQVDDHNAKRHKPISLEVTWATTRWACRVFAFLLAISEVNAFLCDNFLFDADHSSMLAFRKSLAKALINNDYYEEPESPQERLQRRVETHELLKIPKNKRFRNDGTFEFCRTDHNRRQCSDCRRRTRTYCKCSPGMHLCSECYADHRITVDSEV